MTKIIETILGKKKRWERSTFSENPILSTSLLEREPVDLAIDSEENLIGYYPNPFFKEDISKIKKPHDQAITNSIDDAVALINCTRDCCTHPDFRNPPSKYDSYFYSRLPKDELDESKIALMQAISTRLQQYHQNREILENNSQYMRMLELMNAYVYFFTGTNNTIGNFLIHTAPKLGYRINVEWPLANIILGREINLKEYFETWNLLYKDLNKNYAKEISDLQRDRGRGGR